jgi:hypothetical protein
VALEGKVVKRHPRQTRTDGIIFIKTRYVDHKVVHREEKGTVRHTLNPKFTIVSEAQQPFKSFILLLSFTKAADTPKVYCEKFNAREA